MRRKIEAMSVLSCAWKCESLHYQRQHDDGQMDLNSHKMQSVNTDWIQEQDGLHVSFKEAS